MNKVIEFQDNGQDFLTFEVTPKGEIIDVQPFQFDLWSKYKVMNISTLKVGGFVSLYKQTINDVKAEMFSIKYPVVSIVDVNSML